ncbi:hypothetical protein BCV70DRAFT_166278, partial [Testicularia cyperi]
MVDSSGAPVSPGVKDADDDDDDNKGGDEGGEDDEEYEIEYIVSHSDKMVDGQMSYFVKWQGYPDSENTWVFESDMGGAQEMIQEYWAKQPKKQLKKMGTKAGKKGKRQSSVGGSSAAAIAAAAAASSASRRRSARESSSAHRSANARDSPSASTSAAAAGSSRRGKRAHEIQPSRSPTPDGPLIDRMRKRYARIPDWDPIVAKIEAVEKTHSNKIRMFVRFQSGDRLAFESTVCHHRCPLKVIEFYESHLRFK